jgi:hypothetical protein
MRALWAVGVILAASALAAGCFEGKADLALNPDGTGKIVGELTFPLESPWTGPKRPTPAKSSTSAASAASPAPEQETKTPEEQMKEVVYSILKRSSGIDAWKDVSFELVGANRVRLKGTAYFRDLSKVRIYPQASRTGIGFGSDGGNGMMLVLHRPEDAADTRPRSGRELPAEEVAKRLKEERARYQAVRGTMSLMVSGLKCDLSFNTPGTPTEVRGLQQQGPVLSFSIDGTKLMQSFDAVMTDNAILTRTIFAGERLGSTGGQFEAALEKRFFGGAKGECWARILGPFTPRFNYAAEAEVARKGEKEMMAKLGLEQPRTTRPPAKPSEPAPKKPADTPAKKPAVPPARKPADPGLPGKLPAMPRDVPNIPTPIFPGL